LAKTILGLAGSCRRGGNTETLLDWCLDAAREQVAQVAKYRLCDLDVCGCRGCGGCSKDGVCVIKDAMQELYPHLREADAIALAAPVYHMGMPAVPKMMIDRSQPFWALKYVLGRGIGEGRTRLGAFLSCAGTEYADVFAGTTQVVRAFWHILEIKEAGMLLYPGVDEAGAIRSRPLAREEAAGIGRLLAGTTPKTDSSQDELREA